MAVWSSGEAAGTPGFRRYDQALQARRGGLESLQGLHHATRPNQRAGQQDWRRRAADAAAHQPVWTEGGLAGVVSHVFQGRDGPLISIRGRHGLGLVARRRRLGVRRRSPGHGRKPKADGQQYEQQYADQRHGEGVGPCAPSGKGSLDPPHGLDNDRLFQPFVLLVGELGLAAGGLGEDLLSVGKA